MATSALLQDIQQIVAAVINIADDNTTNNSTVYIGEDLGFSVPATYLGSTATPPPEYITIPGGYQYTVYVAKTINGLSGLAKIVATVKVANGQASLTAVVTLSINGVPVGPSVATIVTTVTPSTPIPFSTNMVFTVVAVATVIGGGNYTASGIFTINSNDFLHPVFTRVTAVGMVSGTSHQVLPLGALRISYNTTEYGADIREVLATLTSDMEYCDQYPKELIGLLKGAHLTDCSVQIFLHQVNFRKVLRGCGKYVLEKAESLLNEYSIDQDLITFYANLSRYMVIRYTVSSLLWRRWDERWLLGKYYCEFLRQLGESEFCYLLPIFQCEYADYNQYMLEDYEC
jgi:hypothetical protein